MSVAASQGQTLLRLLAELRPHWRRDFALPRRIQTLLAAHRAFGSRDRRLYRELIYTTLRHLPLIEPLLAAQPEEALRQLGWLAADTPATRAFRAHFAVGNEPTFKPQDSLPPWFEAHAPEVFLPAEAATQLKRPPIWLRLQTDEPASVTEELTHHRLHFHPHPQLANALAVTDETDLTKLAAFADGAFEIQDAGSQAILELVSPEPGAAWLDACAGAGGKTLQLARLLGAEGRIDAYDVRPAALDELAQRAQRAGARCNARAGSPARPNLAQLRTLNTPPTTELYDGVLVDAPCSGTGTWRRAPHLKWLTTDGSVRAHATRQLQLLDTFAQRVRPGGQLVYATCSLSILENQAVVAAFRSTHPEFAPETPKRPELALPRGDGWLILPSRHDGDGFFTATLRRK
jgi:16S rRNA (cytosine967-C5)-methyltransferase